MNTVKESIQSHALPQVADDSGQAEALYHSYVVEKIRRGLESASQGVLTQEQVEKRMEKWLSA